MSPKAKRKPSRKAQRKKTPKHVRLEVGPTSVKEHLETGYGWRVIMPVTAPCSFPTSSFGDPRKAQKVHYIRSKGAALVLAKRVAIDLWDTAQQATTTKIKNSAWVYVDEKTYPRATDPYPPRG